VCLAGQSPAAEARFVRQERSATGSTERGYWSACRSSGASRLALIQRCTPPLGIGLAHRPRIGSAAPAMRSRTQRDAVSASL